MREDQGSRRSLGRGARRLRLVALATGAALLVGGLASVALVGRLAHAHQQTLTDVLAERTDVVTAFADDAASVTRLASHDAAFRDVYAGAGGRAVTPADLGRRDADRVGAALEYLRSTFPDEIAEACFVDGGGAELGRVVQGLVPGTANLSPDESARPFFRPALASAGDVAYQPRPYVSPDTRTWVLASAAPVRLADGGPAVAVVHLEVTLESLRRRLAHGLRAGTRVVVVDARTGDVVVDSAVPVLDGDAAAAAPATGRYDVSAWGGRTLLQAGGEDLAVRRPAPGAVNDWYVVVSAGARSGWVSGALPVAPVLATLLGAFLLLVAAFGFAEHGRMLLQRAHRDSLTGLANRDGLLDRLARGLAARQGGAGRPDRLRAVLLADLDRFKHVNDTLGHGAGDRLLAEVARRIGSGHGPHDVVARLGGDEFALLVHGDAGPDDLLRRARDLVHRLDAPFVLDGVQVHVSASVGVALAGEHGDDAATVLRRADLAMYEAKRRRTGTALYTSALDAAPARSLAFETELVLAMERDELVLHYQPQVDLRTGRIRGVEALVRWQHPELGPLLPAAFVPAAEESGIIVGLTRHVLGLALDQVRTWRAAGLDVVVAVNIGARNVADPQLPTEVLRLLAERGLPASVLRVELTETDLLGDPEQARCVLQALRDSGIGIAVDDFGTGFASLTQLRSLPFDELKIDKSFVQVIDTDHDAAHIVTTVVDLAHGLGLVVTAEGVETPESLAALAEIGCDTVQGYLLGRPMPAEEAWTWLLGHDPQSVGGRWRRHRSRASFGHVGCSHRHGH
ncbi:bifunctional diguanylate cyclase/phosphodiesterase [Kineosporia sp. A_224]|uniref:putative bifunctional diguanylate cyclase/phosphodiesterase n=1 Tax=Kineosporia sp. A_224 TaxID=1962180 RepID=UPI000B4C17BE|nr:EAL domain-containing protein [Kineosporia sp. A_224]